MKKPALRKDRYEREIFSETEWTKSSKSVGEYIFRRLSLDQSNENFSKIRPRHQLSKLFVTSKEIEMYVIDYLKMMEEKTVNTAEGIHLQKSDTIDYIDNNNCEYPVS